MKISALAPWLLGTALLSAVSCQSSPGAETNHWNIDSLNRRVAYHFLGYREDLDGLYRNHQWNQKQDINRSARRHFLNNNPDNPFQAADPSLNSPRPPHSLLPDPVNYFHLESITTGLGLLAITGAFIPIPVGSILGTIEEGGAEEFGQGVHTTLTGSYGQRLGQPPSVEEFRVRNQRLR